MGRMPDPMWTPDPAAVDAARITDFARFAETRTGLEFGTYDALLHWSVDDLEAFWRCLWDYFDVIAETGSDTVLTSAEMPGAEWFPDARLNYVDQVFRDRPEHGVAIIEVDEAGRHAEDSGGQLRQQVGPLAGMLRDLGVTADDRVAAYLPNTSEAVVAFLATASLGAI